MLKIYLAIEYNFIEVFNNETLETNFKIIKKYYDIITRN